MEKDKKKFEIRSANKEKHEALNSKYETNLNDKNPKFKTFWSFGHLNFDIVSDFGIRISDFDIR